MDSSRKMGSKKNPTLSLDLCIHGFNTSILVELFSDVHPEKFLALSTGEKGTKDTTRKKLYFKGSIFHHLTPEIMAQGGKFSERNGTVGESTNGEYFEGENFKLLHDEPGLLSMPNDGPQKDGSEFFITMKAVPHLNGKHHVFGKVVSGMETVMLIVQANTNDRKSTCLVKFVEFDEVHEAVLSGKGKRITKKLGKCFYPDSYNEKGKKRHVKSLEHGKKKRRRRYSSSDSFSGDSDSSSSDSSSSDGRCRRKKTLKDKHTLGRRKKSEWREKKRGHGRRARAITKWTSEISSDTESDSSGIRSAEEVACHRRSAHKADDKPLHVQYKSGKRRCRKSLSHRKKKHRRHSSSDSFSSDSESSSSDLSSTDGRRKRKKTSNRDKYKVEKKKRGMLREKKRRRCDKRPRLTVKWSSEISTDTESDSTSNRSAGELALHGGFAHKAYDKSLHDQDKSVHGQVVSAKGTCVDELKKSKVKTTRESSSLEEGEIPAEDGEHLNKDFNNEEMESDKYSGSDVESKARSICPTGKDCRVSVQLEKIA